MECLFEFFVEFIGEAVIECTLYFYMWLMRLIVPEKTLSPNSEKRIRRIVTVYSALLLTSLIVGVVFLLSTEFVVFGKCMTFIPLGLIVVQFVIGIAFRIFLAAKKKK